MKEERERIDKVMEEQTKKSEQALTEALKQERAHYETKLTQSMANVDRQIAGMNIAHLKSDIKFDLWPQVTTVKNTQRDLVD